LHHNIQNILKFTLRKYFYDDATIYGARMDACHRQLRDSLIKKFYVREGSCDLFSEKNKEAEKIDVLSEYFFGECM